MLILSVSALSGSTTIPLVFLFESFCYGGNPSKGFFVKNYIKSEI